jgi:hypothetical protein
MHAGAREHEKIGGKCLKESQVLAHWAGSAQPPENLKAAWNPVLAPVPGNQAVNLVSAHSYEVIYGCPNMQKYETHSLGLGKS